jgi:hypothetical protein
MKKIMMMLLLVMTMLVGASLVSAEEDCCILSVENVAPGVFQIKMNLKTLPEGKLIFSVWTSKGWTEYPASIVNGVGVATLEWPINTYIEFSYGVGLPNNYESWIIPFCSRYYLDMHFKVFLKEKLEPSVPTKLPPGALLLLQKKK